MKINDKDVIYLDYAANTPVDEEVLKTYVDAERKYIANANSTHILGKIAKEEIDKRTENIMNNLKNRLNISDDMEIIYTSGSSESNNLAIKGVAHAYRNTGKHIITSFMEHSSVSSPLTRLKEKGYEIDIVDIDENGKIDIESLKGLIRDDTILVAISSVDSETGTIEPIEEIARIVKEKKNTMLFVDCTQSTGKVDVNLKDVDLFSFSSHKFYGLNGFGALVKKREIVLEPLIHGGKSTSIYRSGTPVTSQIVALDMALDLALKKQDERYEYVKKLNDYLREKLSKFSDVEFNSMDRSNPYILNFSVLGIKAYIFKNELEKYNVCISVKSACSMENTPSRVVMAITKDKKRAMSSLRISLSHMVTFDEIDKFINIFSDCYLNLKGEK